MITVIFMLKTVTIAAKLVVMRKSSRSKAIGLFRKCLSSELISLFLRLEENLTEDMLNMCHCFSEFSI